MGGARPRSRRTGLIQILEIVSARARDAIGTPENLTAELTTRCQGRRLTVTHERGASALTVIVSALTMAPLIHVHGAGDDDAHRHHLVIHRDVDEVEAVGEDAHGDHAEQRVADAAPAAPERGA